MILLKQLLGDKTWWFRQDIFSFKEVSNYQGSLSGLAYREGATEFAIFKETGKLVFQTASQKFDLDLLASLQIENSQGRAIVHRRTGRTIFRELKEIERDSDPWPDPNMMKLEDWLDDVLNGSESKIWFLDNWPDAGVVRPTLE